jgi:hypothetical protein
VCLAGLTLAKRVREVSPDAHRRPSIQVLDTVVVFGKRTAENLQARAYWGREFLLCTPVAFPSTDAADRRPRILEGTK